MDKNTQEYLDEFKETFMPKGFEWRKGQKEAIISIIEAYDNKVKVVILDAATGSGKSLIAICSSWILNQRNIKGYILASDISLQEQYEKDIKQFKMNWGSVKGIDNYLCSDNLEKNSLGTCRVRNKAPKSMYCFSECPYFSARDHASLSSTTLLNYAYWLIMQNYVNDKSNEKEHQLFPKRQFTFCDEAHKILDIVQNHYSPKFDKKIVEKLEKLTNFFNIYKLHNHIADFQNLKIEINKIKDEENQDKLYKILSNIEIALEQYLSTIRILKDQVAKEYPKDDPPKEWKEALRLCDWLKDFHCKIEDFVHIISKTSTRNIIKNPSGYDEFVFNCLEESYMMNKYFHEHAGFTVLMSATFADPRDYIKSISINDAKYIKIDSTFDFSKSPIYFYNKRRMSYNQLESNLPWLYSTIDKILDNHPNENGIIHSASYKLTMNIYNNVSRKNQKRILVYEGTSEKRDVIEMFKKDNSKILMGPSLTHGINLPDEQCRFIIVAKTPYLSLSDRFVKTKLDLNPTWYSWKACLDIQQGIGRGVRHETDWCISYYLDATLADLIHKKRSSFPIEFLQRIVIKE